MSRSVGVLRFGIRTCCFHNTFELCAVGFNQPTPVSFDVMTTSVGVGRGEKPNFPDLGMTLKFDMLHTIADWLE